MSLFRALSQLKGLLMHWFRCAQSALLAGTAFVMGVMGVERPATHRRALAFEPLESRLPMSAVGLVDVGAQPTGGLSGKITYIHAGHGYTAANLVNGNWSFQRGPLLGMIEDLGNIDQMTYLADYLFRAGATVVPLRPIGHQTNEAVLDNDDAGVSFSGTWSNSVNSVFFGSAGDVPYRYATTQLTETAYARYRPNITEAGFYPVYSWTLAGSDRAPDQLYRVKHSGGITEVKVNHLRVGSGLVYLGTYYFEAGTDGYVDISNKSSVAGRVAIADMIRFGNGMGDIDRGGGVSGLPREDESGLYWVQWHVDRSQGIPTSEYRTNSEDRTAAISFSPRYAEFMNRQQDGALKDRVWVSYHSNASGGRGVLGLYNGNNTPSSATPNQFLLANSLGVEVNNDLVAQNGRYEFDWFDRGTNVTLDRSDIEFGEINNSVINNEFDATIVEVAFHDDAMDAALMRDPKVRDAVARATYQGMVNYFRGVDGNTTPVTKLPGVVSGVHVESNASGSVTISWVPPAANTYNGDAATSYRVYASTNGYGFDGGTVVAGGATTSATLTGYDPNTPYYFKVVAVNEGGESAGSEVLAVTPSGGPKQVLVVNGFDRLDKSLNPKQPAYQGVVVDRVRSRQSNARDYTVQVASAIHAAAPGVHVNSTSNEAVINGAVNLADYHSVVWILGEESSADDTFDATEQFKVAQFLAGGGNLFVSGAEIAWDLDNLNNGRVFFENTLKGNYVSDDANTYNVSGTTGRIFSGLSFSFDNGTLFYNSEFPDVINPLGGAQTALSYVGGIGGSAAIQYNGVGSSGSIVMLGFPFETITTAANRTVVMERVLNFFELAAPVIENADFNGDGVVDAADYVVWRQNENTTVPAGTMGDANFDTQVNAADYQIWRAQFGTNQAAAATATPATVAQAAPQAAAASADDVQLVPDVVEVLDPAPVEESAAEPAAATTAEPGDAPAVVPAPAGALTGKIVYTSAGHGWQWSTTLGRFATDRGDNNEIVEDFGNQDQLTFYADYLLRAGATVVPMRPIGRQINEVVLDVDSPGVTFSGSWSTSTAAVHYDEDYGAVADTVSYRFASINAAQTAVATYRPTIPQAGFYPVYTWVADGSNRTNQLYRIHDSGGVTEIRVDHRMVGKGWVYLGTYHFEAGTGGYVEISNQSTAGGSVVIADAIRFGNGMGDVPWGPSGIGTGSVSGYPREDENSLMWLWRAVGQGNNPSTVLGTSNVSAPSRMAEHMNANTNPFGTSVYIGFHSNAGGGRGAVGLIDSDQGTPNQAALALYTGRQINQDMQALNGQFEFNWFNRTTHTFTSGFGEIDEGASAEMDMTIIEVAFHDSVEDAAIMRDPKGREQLARSTYEATLEYFDNFGGLNSPVSQPSAPSNVRAIAEADGDIVISWTAGPVGVKGGTPTGFRVYTSRNGYGFSDYVNVSGAGATSYTIPAGQLDGDAYYFKVVAVNTGGESPRSTVAAARKDAGGGANSILIVDGFDRFDRTQNVRYSYAFTGDGLVDRVWARSNNSFDYAIQVGEAIEAYENDLGFDFVQNEAVINGQVNLANYGTVIWISGEESTANNTFNATEQTKVEQFIAGGGNFFVSGTEIGWDLDQQDNGRVFYENTLKANFVGDDANSYTVTPVAGGIFAGLVNFSFDNGAQFYNADTPDRISAQPGAQVALNYVGGAGGGAAIQSAPANGRGGVVMLAFPFETITTAANRAAVLDRVFDFFGLNVPPPPAVDLETAVNGQDADAPTGPTLAAGGTATFTYTVTNAGSVPVGNIVVVDDNGTPSDTGDDFNPTFVGGDTNSNNLLDAGETWTYSAMQLVAAGQATHFARVSGEANSLTAEDADPVNYFGSAPAVVVETYLSADDADSPPGPTVTAGDTTTILYLVTNTGNIELTNVVVVDDNGTPGDFGDDLIATYGSGDSNFNNMLDFGEVWAFFTQFAAVAGQQLHVGTAIAQDSIGQFAVDNDATHYFGQSATFDSADFNDDGIVDAADYVMWRYYENQTVPAGTLGDANHDTQVDQADYLIWRAQFGTNPAASATAVARLNPSPVNVAPADVAPVAATLLPSTVALETASDPPSLANGAATANAHDVALASLAAPRATTSQSRLPRVVARSTGMAYDAYRVQHATSLLNLTSAPVDAGDDLTGNLEVREVEADRADEVATGPLSAARLAPHRGSGL